MGRGIKKHPNGKKMIFIECKLKDVNLIKLKKVEDKRGYFARSFCKNEFKDMGLESDIVQCNVSYSEKKGTLRGMHFQNKPFEECKIVSCTKGSIYDVVIDLRENSSTYLEWEGFILTEENRDMLYIPRGFAHGFQTLEDHSIVSYLVTQFYNKEYEGGVRWNDETFGIDWPTCHDRIISFKDKHWSDYKT